MFPNSIRLRITLWYVAVLAAVLSVCSFIVYGLLAQSRIDRLEARIEVAVHVVASSLEHEIEEHSGTAAGEASFRRVLVAIHHLSFPDLALAVIRDRATVGEKADSEGWKVPPEELARADAARLVSKPKPGETFKWAQSGRRYVAMRVELKDSLPYLFVGSASEHEAQEDIVAVRNAFLIGLPVSLLLSAAGGWWLARKSFSPIRAMMDAVDGITANVLDRRLPVPASGDELARLAGTFNNLLGRLEHSFEMQRQFMADASHELRTPIFVAHTAGQVVLGSPHRSTDEYREAVQTIDAQLVRLGRLVHDMFLLARVDSGGVPLQISKFYLEEAIADCVKTARMLARTKNIRVEADEFSESPCQGDESLIRQAVMILLDNAIKYSGNESVVRVYLTREQGGEAGGGLYSILVSDTGPGIAPGIQSRIFERFFRADKARSRTTSNSGGAGLGLPIASWIAAVHGGDLELSSSSESGSSFRLRLRECVAQESCKPAGI
jgi:heavy metal sensor kinase